MEKVDYSKIYSYSKLGLFDKCPKQYYFSYLDPEVAPIKKQFRKQRDYQTKGLAVHGAITLFYHLSVGERTFENLKKCLLEAWFSEIDPVKTPPLGKLGGFEGLEHERQVYGGALKLLKNFLVKKDFNPALFYLPSRNIKNSFDDYKNLIKPMTEELFVSGKFDRIDKLKNGNLRVVDFKTGKRERDYSQLEFYKVLAELNFNTQVETVSFYYLADRKIEDFNVSDVDTNRIKDRILEKVENIKNTQKFLPRSSGLCNHCDFKEICPSHQR